MFLINSRPGPFTATPQSLRSKSGHLKGHSFFRSYGANLPSSLTIVLPIALVCSTRPPVSVLVRAPWSLPRSFFKKQGITDFTHSLRRHASGLMRRWIFLPSPPTRFHGDVQNPARLSFSVTPSVKCDLSGTGMSTCCASTTPYRPRLSSRLTLGGLTLPRKPWTYGGDVFHITLVTRASILSSELSTHGYPLRFNLCGMLPYHRSKLRSAASVPYFSPVNCRRMFT